MCLGNYLYSGQSLVLLLASLVHGFFQHSSAGIYAVLLLLLGVLVKLASAQYQKPVHTNRVIGAFLLDGVTEPVTGQLDMYLSIPAETASVCTSSTGQPTRWLLWPRNCESLIALLAALLQMSGDDRLLCCVLCLCCSSFTVVGRA